MLKGENRSKKGLCFGNDFEALCHNLSLGLLIGQLVLLGVDDWVGDELALSVGAAVTVLEYLGYDG